MTREYSRLGDPEWELDSPLMREPTPEEVAAYAEPTEWVDAPGHQYKRDILVVIHEAFASMREKLSGGAVAQPSEQGSDEAQHEPEEPVYENDGQTLSVRTSDGSRLSDAQKYFAKLAAAIRGEALEINGEQIFSPTQAVLLSKALHSAARPIDNED